jgi:hypothetical protein
MHKLKTNILLALVADQRTILEALFPGTLLSAQSKEPVQYESPGHPGSLCLQTMKSDSSAACVKWKKRAVGDIQVFMLTH